MLKMSTAAQHQSQTKVAKTSMKRHADDNHMEVFVSPSNVLSRFKTTLIRIAIFRKRNPKIVFYDLFVSYHN